MSAFLNSLGKLNGFFWIAYTNKKSLLKYTFIEMHIKLKNIKLAAILNRVDVLLVQSFIVQNFDFFFIIPSTLYFRISYLWYFTDCMYTTHVMLGQQVVITNILLLNFVVLTGQCPTFKLAKLGSNITLSCPLVGAGNKVIFSHRKPLSYPKNKYILSGNNLIIKNFSRGDDMHYKCEVKNGSGHVLNSHRWVVMINYFIGKWYNI